MTSRLGIVLVPILLLGALLTLSGCVSQEELTATANREYSLDVNYDRTFEESIKAGNYGWVYHEITAKNFPSNESGIKTLRVVLVALDSHTVIEDVLREQAGKGRRPASLKELLAFGESYPEVQTRFALLGLGSHCDLIVVRMGVFNPHTLETETVRSLERLYPYLSREMPGRTANLMETGSVSKYHSPKLYGTFIALEEKTE